jgi:hypothetical protein
MGMEDASVSELVENTVVVVHLEFNRQVITNSRSTETDQPLDIIRCRPVPVSELVEDENGFYDRHTIHQLANAFNTTTVAHREAYRAGARNFEVTPTVR